MTNCPIYTNSLKIPDNKAWTFDDQSISYKQANELIIHNQLFLKKLGLKKGDSIALQSENTARFLALVFAANRESLTSVILGDFSSKDGKEKAILRTNSKLINLNEIPLKDEPQANSTYHELDYHYPAIVLFTSGSTGIEKGVILTLNNIYKSAEASNELTHLDENSVWLSSLTFSRIGGLAIPYRTAITGASVEFLEQISMPYLSEILRQDRISHASLVPTQLQELMKTEENIQGLKKMKCILLGGAPASEKLLKDIVSNKVPILTTYGMTETSSHISLAASNDPIERVYSSGKILRHSKVRFRNEKGEASSEPNFVGVLEVSGETLSPGYIDEAGQDKYLNDGWYNTGDIAFLDEHLQLHIIGRSDSMIISGGENIHLREIEIVAERMPGVEAAAAIPIPHEKWGQRPILFIESKTLNKDSIIDYLKQKLSKIKVPDQVIVLESLPRISIGKIDYQSLKNTKFN